MNRTHVLALGTIAVLLVGGCGTGPDGSDGDTRAGGAVPAIPAAAGSVPPVERPETGLLHLRPVEVEIPALGVRSRLVDLGLQPDGALETPTDYALAGWYTGGPYPGDAGGPPALIVGHVDDQNGPAVFFRLRDLRPGDEILVHRTDDSTAVFTVYDTEQYAKAGFPTQDVYAPSDDAELRLITCTGAFDAAARSYLDNFVVFATLDRAASESRA